MTKFLRSALLKAAILLIAGIGYFSTAQKSFAEVDCTKTPKTNFEDATCQSRWKAGLLKSAPPQMPRKPYKKLTPEEERRSLNDLCALIGPMACSGSYPYPPRKRVVIKASRSKVHR